MVLRPEVSEESSKKRGRPPAFPSELEHAYQSFGLFEPGDTRRTNINKMYRLRAFEALGLGEAPIPEPFAWLVIEKTGKLRETILVELGRIPHPDDIREVATSICTLKPKARDAAAMIRRWRTGAPDREPNIYQLALELLRQVDDYRVRVPATDWGQVLRALDYARDAIAEQAFGDEST